jgi:hypothetical protein
MSMNFSEFRRILGAEPRNQESEFLEARSSDPEFTQAADLAEVFECKLDRALELDTPASLVNDIKAISTTTPARSNKLWQQFAIAAGVLMAVGVTGMVWNMNRGWDSVEDYVVDHFEHDGKKLLVMAEDGRSHDLADILARFGIQMTDDLAGSVDYSRICPTPDGKGVHLVINTSQGPVSVLLMPETPVSDGQDIHFDGMHARLLSLNTGSAVVIGNDEQELENIFAKVHAVLMPAAASA